MTSKRGPRAIAALLALSGCGSRSAAPLVDVSAPFASSGEAPSASPAPHAPPAAPVSNGDAPDQAMLRTVCSKAPCSGKLARVIVYRDKAGSITSYLHLGDPTICADAPSDYFDPAGGELGGIGMFPVVVGSDEDKKLAERRRTLERGGHSAESFQCGSVR